MMILWIRINSSKINMTIFNKINTLIIKLTKIRHSKDNLKIPYCPNPTIIISIKIVSIQLISQIHLTIPILINPNKTLKSLILLHILKDIFSIHKLLLSLNPKILLKIKPNSKRNPYLISIMSHNFSNKKLLWTLYKDISIKIVYPNKMISMPIISTYQ